MSMPSFSFATSATGRMVAAWEISISDFGLACCSAGLRMWISPLNELAAELVADFDAAGGGELGARDLARVAAHSQHADTAVGAGHGEALGVDLGHFAHGAG